MSDTHDLWVAVDRITKPSTVRLDRDTGSEWDPEWSKWLLTGPHLNDRDRATYRAATAGHGTVASLWQQAVWALTARALSSAGNPSPLAARSPMDLALMEIMADVRETVAGQLAVWGLAGRLTVPDQLRQLAAHVGGHVPDDVGWWTYRVGQWARVLGVYLRAVDVGPRPVRLRGATCPQCTARTVTVESRGERIVVPALYIDFSEDGYVRACECLSCHFAWWRGDDLERLAVELNPVVGSAEGVA